MKIKIRHANLNDEMLLLSWANDSTVRENAFNSQFITPAAHHEWLYGRLNECSRCQIFIAEEEGVVALGQVRFEKKGPIWEIDYSIDKDFRSRGLGELVLNIALKKMKYNYPESCFVGYVKKGNTPSSKVFEKLGFVAEIKADFVIWRSHGK
ncbi:GNAT family N-acetyltransferase [Polynucleobacter alcilacus]|uniref:GNAT family N-acetyltransferase n=1 Tax=Polynucleobacter alcilacus TaxID=1819739 RepID=UPI001C0B3D93|nr:GNAT family N-acetyltransferase [Polynucleobacter alcilacus]MBU3568172.1 GNAT family N-acetyltransferase [Polynucleobacter alcilacus]